MSTFYIKRAGKLYGPFSFEQATSCINRGTFTEQDMISADRVTWDSVEEFRKKGKFFEEPGTSSKHDEVVLKKLCDSEQDAVVPIREEGHVSVHLDGGNASEMLCSSTPPRVLLEAGQNERWGVSTATGDPHLVDQLGKTINVASKLGYIALGFFVAAFVSGVIVNENQEGLLICGVCFIIFMLVYCVFVIFGLIALHRAWQTIPWEEARTTPGKAVGFLFIPFFNVYWLFVAFYGLASDLNNRAGRMGLRQYASEGETLLCCILVIVSFVFSFIFQEYDFVSELCFFVPSLAYGIMLVKLPRAAWKLAIDCNVPGGAGHGYFSRGVPERDSVSKSITYPPSPMQRSYAEESDRNPAIARTENRTMQKSCAEERAVELLVNELSMFSRNISVQRNVVVVSNIASNVFGSSLGSDRSVIRLQEEGSGRCNIFDNTTVSPSGLFWFWIVFDILFTGFLGLIVTFLLYIYYKGQVTQNLNKALMNARMRLN